MSNVRLSPDVNGVQVEIDGQVIADVRSAVLRATADDVVTLTLEVFVGPLLDVRVSAQVRPTFILLSDNELVVEPQPDGTTRYRGVTRGQ